MIDESFLRKLERLSLVVRRARAGQIKGERRSTKRGTSVEFADYRNYARGDDLRWVDWNIYARLQRPFVKLFEEEEDLVVHLLLDASRSMDWGDESQDKWSYAQRTAAALGYIALAGGDRLAVTALQEGGNEQWGVVRGRSQVLRLLEHLDGLEAAGTTDLNRSLQAYALAAGRPGLLFLLSDLFSPAGYDQGLLALRSRGYEVNVIHILSPDEIEPSFSGDLRLLDVETGGVQEVTIDGGMLALYRRRLVTWRREIETYCLSRDINYVSVETSLPFDELILYHLRRRGLVK